MAIEVITHHKDWHVIESSDEPEMNEIYEDILDEFK